MSHAALTTRYRPQTFAELAGQETLKAILSRAAAQDKVAPAYLFSGTRGVGKTTVARVFAKALNCEQAPASEPCNECRQCLAVMQGNNIDVVEMDAASNRGIDDVKRLKEFVGYAPMSGRYKVFIIDEAHMLSREAFNALLKTLEEPPARVTFILATTEPHKVPATILSRCQHFVFKRLTDAELIAHLKNILDKEQAPYEEAAVRLIARRAAGSARDSMSLLGQVLALGGEKLTEAGARSVLGLAGQELFSRLLSAIKAGDAPALSVLVRDMLDQGLDLGFFLREFTAMWRNLFMLRQAGAAAFGVVDLPEAEAAAMLREAEGLALTQIHASWQMTLEGQRRVLQSLEPALALELLLLNLALLPRLLPLGQIAAVQKRLPDADPAKAAGEKHPLPEPPPTAPPEAPAPAQAKPMPPAAKPERRPAAQDAQALPPVGKPAPPASAKPSTATQTKEAATPARPEPPAPRPAPKADSLQEIKTRAEGLEEISLLKTELNARLIDCGPWRK